MIVTFTHSVLDDEITTNISQAQWGARPDSGTCVFSDDDLSIEADFIAGVVGSDIGTGTPPNAYLPLPDLSGLETHYRRAYIKPTVLQEHTTWGGIAFVKNIDDIENASAWNAPLLLRTLAVSTPPFWTAYVYSAFQAERNEDYDGEVTATKGINTHIESLFGDTKPYSDFGPQYTGMSCVFVESLDDGFGDQTHRITVEPVS